MLQAKNQESNFGSYIADDKGNISPEIQAILDITAVEQKPKDITELVALTQKEWLRKPGTERWDINPNLRQELYDKLEPILKKLGLIDAIMLNDNVVPDYLVILGATSKSLNVAFSFTDKLLEKFKEKKPKVIVLVGQRVITDEAEKAFLKQCNAPATVKTETDAAKFLINLYPQLKSSKSIIFVDTPGSLNQRPTTQDTIKEWLKSNPKFGNIVAISRVPFVQYQDTVLRTYLPEEFTLVTVGPKDDREMSVGLYLDTLARWIYQENERRKVQSKKQ